MFKENVFVKNQEVELTIEDMSVNGEGIGHANGMTFFVKGAVIGDRILAGVTKVKKNLCYARVISITEESPHRSIEKCPKARPCGGCQLQSLNYDKQLELKANHVRNNLIRVGGFEESLIDDVLEPIIGMEYPFSYRNKLQIPVGLDKNGEVVMGFYLSHSHDIVPIEKCYLSIPVIDEVASIVKKWIDDEKVNVYRNDDTNSSAGKYEGILRHILIRYGYNSGEIMVCLIGNARLNDKKDDAVSKFRDQLDKLVERFRDFDGIKSIVFNENCKNTNVILGEKTHLIWGSDSIMDCIRDVAFKISAKSFFQVNPIQTEKLYSKVEEYAALTGNEHIWDLYCGIGTIGIFLAYKAKSVFGVEVVSQAIEDAKENARLNGIDNAEFVVGKAEDVISNITWVDSRGVYKCEGASKKITVNRPDVIVVDPPRKGCGKECVDTILELLPKKVVYVSCNPSTLARDLEILCDSKYELKAVTPVDMFPQTGHVESCGLLKLL